MANGLDNDGLKTCIIRHLLLDDARILSCSILVLLLTKAMNHLRMFFCIAVSLEKPNKPIKNFVKVAKLYFILLGPNNQKVRTVENHCSIILNIIHGSENRNNFSPLTEKNIISGGWEKNPVYASMQLNDSHPKI